MYRFTIAPLALALAFGAGGATSFPLAAAGAPFSLDTTPGRLPKTVVPTDYQIAIVPDVQALTLAGTETVKLHFRQPADSIRFNSLHQQLDHVTLDGKPVKAVVSDDEAQLTTITLTQPASKGKHTLRFTYTGRIETKPQGLFAQPFVKPDGVKDVLLSTQFEATDARRMFPCWDEPAFRATFTLTVTVPSKWKVVSNMPIQRSTRQGDTTTTTFQRSPRMPSYLVEFSAGDLARITSRVGKTELGVWAVRGQEEYGRAALTNAALILADYNHYFGVAFPLPKLDSIAVPGGFGGAMENWGAITYNDQHLLLTSASTLEDQQRVFTIQAHEMAHQWNGDLVTMSWWDDLWLNESFASWRETRETELRHPDWKWWQAHDGSKESAMAADGQPNSHPIEQHVTNELEADSAFDPQITYSKGQAVLRMLEAYLGPETFRDGIRAYMKAHAFSNATSADLWQALSRASGRDVGAIASGWIQQPGFPVVSVAAECDAQGRRTLTLSQQRFLLQGTDPANPQWSIPLQLRLGTNAPQALLLTNRTLTVSAGRGDEPLSVDAGDLGYYRVSYDAATLQLNTRCFGALPDTDRVALLDDQWALVECGAQKLPAYLALATALGADLEERAWSQVTGALGQIEYDERGTSEHDGFTAYARSLLKPVAARLGWEARPGERPGLQHLRRTVLGDLGEWGDPEVIAEARRRFAAFVKDRSAIRPDDQAMVLRIVARQADQATFDQLHAIARSARNETEVRRFYGLLGCVRDPKLAEQAVQIALSDEIPAQAGTLRLHMIGELDYHRQLGWKALTEHCDLLMKPYSPFGPEMLARMVPLEFWKAVPLSELETWLRAHVPAELAPDLERGLAAARFQLALQQRLVPAMDDYLLARSLSR